jgi:hypothetical protein
VIPETTIGPHGYYQFARFSEKMHILNCAHIVAVLCVFVVGANGGRDGRTYVCTYACCDQVRDWNTYQDK